MSFMKKILYFIILSCLLISCNQKKTQHINGTALGTYYNITYICSSESNCYPTLLKVQIDSVLQDVNSTFSVFDTNSLISRINNGKDSLVNEDFQKILLKSLDIHKKTDGAFECTIQPLIELWGFGRENQKQIVPQDEIDSIMQYVGSNLVTVKNGKVIKQDNRIQLNFNAIAKGFAVDKVAAFLQQQGIGDFLVEIGGEIVTHGTKNGQSWSIGIQTPTESADGAIESSQSFSLTDKAVATSGNYRNYFEKDGVRYTHILNPKNGQPEQTNLLSVTVIADDCTTADAYATAFMVLGLDKSSDIVRSTPSLEAYFIYDCNGKFQTKHVKYGK